MKECLVLRAPSGISGDMLLTGLAVVGGVSAKVMEELVDRIGVPELRGALSIGEVMLGGVSGWRAALNLPAQKCAHTHRHFAEIRDLVAGSAMDKNAKEIAQKAFADLADVEGQIHGIKPDRVAFHEVGGLDSILDICLVAALYARLKPAAFVCSPLPLCDGVIDCAHGKLSSPAPATLKLLEGVPVYGVESSGETVTPTGIALLKACGARFGEWPALTITKSCRVYGSRVLPNIPNGAIFALGCQE